MLLSLKPLVYEVFKDPRNVQFLTSSFFICIESVDFMQSFFSLKSSMYDENQQIRYQNLTLTKNFDQKC